MKTEACKSVASAVALGIGSIAVVLVSLKETWDKRGNVAALTNFLLANEGRLFEPDTFVTDLQLGIKPVLRLIQGERVIGTVRGVGVTGVDDYLLQYHLAPTILDPDEKHLKAYRWVIEYTRKPNTSNAPPALNQDEIRGKYYLKDGRLYLVLYHRKEGRS